MQRTYTLPNKKKTKLALGLFQMVEVCRDGTTWEPGRITVLNSFCVHVQLSVGGPPVRIDMLHHCQKNSLGYECLRKIVKDTEVTA